MLKNRLLSLINEMIQNLGGTQIETLSPDLKINEDLEIDSISYAELVVNLENEFGVNINNKGKAETIGDILDRLEINA